MYDPVERDRVHARLVGLARDDPRIVAAALTGSLAGDVVDEWSDVDLALALADGVGLEAIAEDWTTLLEREFGVLQHWDLPYRTSLYRVFLLTSLLEVDLAFVPHADFAARGPKWRVEFGESGPVQESPEPVRDDLVGLGWHHVRHTRAYIARGKPVQAANILAELRSYTITLACQRLGLPTAYARGADELPAELKAKLEETLPRSFDEQELLRALRAAADVLADEVGAELAPIVRRLAAL